MILAAGPAFAAQHADGLTDDNATFLSANNSPQAGANMNDASRGAPGHILSNGVDWAFSRSNSIPANDTLVGTLCDQSRCLTLPLDNVSTSFSGTTTIFNGDPADSTFHFTFTLSGRYAANPPVTLSQKRITVRWS